MTPILFGLSSFLCSALLFWVEPLVGKQLLPLVGGAPAVWNVCLLFFQSALLAGYAFAHGLTRIRSPRTQVALYIAAAALSLFVLPVHFGAAPNDPSRPVSWLFGQLTMSVLLPFVCLAAAAPMLQHWYSRTRAATARDPYFLYAASNTGSLLALLSFPVFLEPNIRIHVQNEIWFGLFAAAVLLCALTSMAVKGPPASHSPDVASDGATDETRAPSMRQLLLWVILAAIPSSLLMGVTTYLTGDVAPVPLLWVIPLAVYLLTFILAFGPLRRGVPNWLHRVTIVLAVAWCTLYRLQATDPLWLLVFVHLLVFAVLALGSHARLAASRPAPAHLTTFYLAVAVGGALGGVFNALVAPALFNSYLEYPLIVLAAVLLNMSVQTRSKAGMSNAVRIAIVCVVVAIAVAAVIPAGPVRVLLIAGAPAVFAYLMSGRSVRFVAALAVVLLTPTFGQPLQGFVLHAERNFYGLLRVTTDSTRQYHELRHGNTLHGASDVKQPGGSAPLMYYSASSPVADVIQDMQLHHDSLRVAVVGLGVGSLAWYAKPGESWTFYEINPAVVRIARDTSYFSFLQHSKAESLAIVTGDARFSLRSAAASTYDLIVLDAFTSDAIPLHLLTTGAIQLYASKLKPDGLLVFHISNRYLDLAPSLAATGASLGFDAFLRQVHVDAEEESKRIESTDWLAFSRSGNAFALAKSDRPWLPVRHEGQKPWTDDYSNIWSAFVR